MCASAAPKPGRKAEALAFIEQRLVATGQSPSIAEIARALRVSTTRASDLVHELASDRAIERAPGAQRAISIPGLFERLVLERLQAEGWTINPEAREVAPPLPQSHLPLIAGLAYLPDDDLGVDLDAISGSGGER